MTIKNANPATYAMYFNAGTGLYYSYPVIPPTQVTGLTVGAVTASTVALSWTAATPGNNPIASYTVYRNSVAVASVASPSVSYTDTALTSPTAYLYAVAAVDNTGVVGVRSNTVTATTTFTITTAALPSATVGVAYSTTLVAAGGIGTLTWAITGQSTPVNAWQLTVGGVLTSTTTPSTAETDSLTFSCTDSAVPANVRTVTLPLIVNASGSASITGGTATSTSLVHGSPYTVTGSNLGTRPNYNINGYSWKGVTHMHFVWCAFDQGNPSVYTQAGWQAVLCGMAPQWYDSTNVQGPVPQIGTGNGPNTSGIYSGGPSAGGYYYQRAPNPTGASSRYGGIHEPIANTTLLDANYAGEYWSCKMQTSGTIENAPGFVKNFRRSYSFNSSLGPSEIETILEFFSGQIQFDAGTAGSATLGWQAPLSNYTSSDVYSSMVDAGSQPNTSSWTRHECVTKFVVGAGVAGTIRQRLNNRLVQFKNSSCPSYFIDVPLIPSGFSAFFDVASSPGMVWGSESRIAGAYNQNFTDIYHDFTAARVEISDGTHSEPQILSAWSNGGINFNFNKGELTSGSGRTLTVYDASENVVATQTVTVA